MTLRPFIVKHLVFGHRQLSTTSELNQIKPYTDLPGPPNYPLIGCLPTLILSGHRGPEMIKYFIQAHDKYGPIYRAKMFLSQPDIVSVFDAESIEKICKVTFDEPIRYAFHALKEVRKNDPNNYFDKKGGILPENGEEWWRVRSRVQTPMMKPKNVTNYLPSMDDVALEFMDRISDLQNNNGGEVPENFTEELYKWALESISLVTLNRRYGCFDPNLSEDSIPVRLIQNVNDMMSSFAETESTVGWWFYKTKAFKTLEKSHQNLIEIADVSIREAEAEMNKDSGYDTIMAQLLRIPGLTRPDIMTMLIDTIFAAIDTTSHTLTFLLYFLSKNPECQIKLQNEIDSIVGSDKETNITVSQLNQMHYLKCILKESLRLQPLTPGMFRQLTKDTELHGYHIPKGTILFGLNIMTSKLDEYFTRPDEFLPQRWSREKPLGEINPYASLPFSHGTRMCIGRRIAEQEIYLFLIRMAQRYTVEYKYDNKPLIKYNFVFAPGFPQNFTFRER